MTFAELEASLSRKYLGEPMDWDTVRHITEDVKSVFDGVADVEVYEDVPGQLKLNVTFKKQEDLIWHLLKNE
jgi:hypothetical protein